MLFRSDYQRNKDIAGLAKLTYVAGPYEPCNVGGEVWPPKAVDNVCSCGEVSVMSGGVVSGSENCWPFVAVDDYFMMTLQIPPPKATMLLEEVLGVMQKCGVCCIGESQGTFSGAKPFTNVAQMVISLAGLIKLGE